MKRNPFHTCVMCGVMRYCSSLSARAPVPPPLLEEADAAVAAAARASVGVTLDAAASTEGEEDDDFDFDKDEDELEEHDRSDDLADLADGDGEDVWEDLTRGTDEEDEDPSESDVRALCASSLSGSASPSP